MADIITFFVAGVPQPGGSKKAFVIPGTNRASVVEDAKRNAPWRERVASCAAEAMGSRPPLSGPVGLSVTFLMPRPKGHFGTGRNAEALRATAPRFHTSRPDSTKLLRALEDACKGITWNDDAQVVSQFVVKIYGSRPGARVNIRRIPDKGVAR